MEDQFGGRTDDDLFFDDFEPVESEPVILHELPQFVPKPSESFFPPWPAQKPRQRQSKPKKASPSTPKSPAVATTAPATHPQPQGGNLSSSRFARKGNDSKPLPAPPASKTASAPKEAKQKPKKDDAVPREEHEAPPADAPTGPAKDRKGPGSQHTSANPAARLRSGANPRQKLTEEELAAKMEQMKLISAEKARKFEVAENDQRQHAEAYAKGMEEARKRRADDAERRRRGEENQRKLDEERAKNRERKLKAMGMKDGGWDEGKEAILEEEARKGFRGANGGIRGAKRGGLGGSKYARGTDDQQPDVDRFLDDRHRGGRGRGGRGARGGSVRGGGPGPFNGAASKSTNPNVSAPVLTTDDFPALPSEQTKKTTESASLPVYPPPKAEPISAPLLPSPLPAGSKWDDEMEALDEANQRAKE